MRARRNDYINAYSCQSDKLSESTLPMRRVTWAEAIAKVKKGEAVWQYGKGGHIKGIRFTERQRLSKRSPSALTKSVMQSVSGEGIGRVHEIDIDHESAEAAMRNKYIVWPFIGDTKAVAVRPRTSEEDLRRANSLFAA